MDFFENQERARRHTKVLIVYFALAVATLIVTAYLAAAFILFHSRGEHGQGVIGHEFSHILNGDMRLNIRLMGLINGILCLAIVGRILLNTTSSRRSNDDRKGGNPLPLFGLALLAIGGIGVFFGRLIQSAV